MGEFESILNRNINIQYLRGKKPQSATSVKCKQELRNSVVDVDINVQNPNVTCRPARYKHPTQTLHNLRASKSDVSQLHLILGSVAF